MSVFEDAVRKVFEERESWSCCEGHEPEDCKRSVDQMMTDFATKLAESWVDAFCDGYFDLRKLTTTEHDR